jgi:hypothetical protein
VIATLVGSAERKVGNNSVTRSRGAGAGVLALGVELLPLDLAVSAGCVVEVAVEAGVFGITTKSVWASEEIGGHFVNVGGLDLKCVAFLAETILVEKIYVSEKHGMPEDLHVLGNDVRVLRKMNHHVDKELVDPHILRDVGAVAVIFERV